MLMYDCMNKHHLDCQAILKSRTLAKLNIFCEPVNGLFDTCGLNTWSVLKERNKLYLSGKQGEIEYGKDSFLSPMKFSLKRNTQNLKGKLNMKCWHHVQWLVTYFLWIFCYISVSKTVVFYDAKTAISEESKYFNIVFMMPLGYEKNDGKTSVKVHRYCF